MEPPNAQIKTQQRKLKRMCRSTDSQGFSFNGDEDRLKVKSFYVRLTDFHAIEKLPENLMLVYLPRISETALEISGKDIRPDTPAFVTLHRVVTAKTEDGEVVYGSREPVAVTEAVSFEVYFREEKALKGIFRKDEEEEWKLECKCVLEREIGDVAARAEVCVGLYGHVAMIERVEMVVNRKTRRRGAFCNFELEEIPEERGAVDFERESDGCCCCSCGEVEGGSDGEELDMEGVRWAVDVGIWVMCLGLGYLVSKASAKSLRRKRIF